MTAVLVLNIDNDSNTIHPSPFHDSQLTAPPLNLKPTNYFLLHLKAAGDRRWREIEAERRSERRRGEDSKTQLAPTL